MTAFCPASEQPNALFRMASKRIKLPGLPQTELDRV
jgi:hypothetical protein